MTQGKVIIIGGTPRAGKTTLATRLAKNGYSKISFDLVSDALRKGFPDLINNWTSQEECAQKKYLFFEGLVEGAVNDAKIYGLNTVFDMFDFTPEYVRKLPFQKDIKVFYLSYPGLTADEIRHNIRFYAEPTDWIAQVDEDYLTEVAQRCYLFNKKLLKQCKEYGYELVDTKAGTERTRTLDELFIKIENL